MLTAFGCSLVESYRACARDQRRGIGLYKLSLTGLPDDVFLLVFLPQSFRPSTMVSGFCGLAKRPVRDDASHLEVRNVVAE